MITIGIDPHKGSHTAVAVDEHEEVLDQLRVKASRRQVQDLLAWAERWPERRWGVEGANGLGLLVAQRLVAAGQDVVDVPAPILGQLIGYSPNIIAEHARAQGTDWAAYAALKSRELDP